MATGHAMPGRLDSACSGTVSAKESTVSNTFTVTGGQASVQQEEDISTASSKTVLKAKVTDVQHQS